MHAFDWTKQISQYESDEWPRSRNVYQYRDGVNSRVKMIVHRVKMIFCNCISISIGSINASTATSIQTTPVDDVIGF